MHGLLSFDPCGFGIVPKNDKNSATTYLGSTQKLAIRDICIDSNFVQVKP